jgi:flagellar biosynthesis chaperone FliJ
MAKVLQRILRIRQLAEEQARLEVERAAQRARQASEACARQATLEHEQRTTLAASWIHGLDDPESNQPGISPANHSSETTEEHGWLMEEAVLEFFGWRRMRLEELREAEVRRMEPLIEDYTERRRELRQTEQLVEQRASTEAMEKNRRAQAETDEWFSQRTLMQRRRELHRASVSRAEASSGEAPLKSNESVLRQF